MSELPRESAPEDPPDCICPQDYVETRCPIHDPDGTYSQRSTPRESAPLSGVDLIAAERERQEAILNWTPAHDDTHGGGEMARAAAVYASPFPLFVKADGIWGETFTFMRIWPRGWDFKGHLRVEGQGLDGTAGLVTPEARIRDLVKAGALIAAEIDRLGRL